MCGSCANECAFKAVFMSYQNKKRGGQPFTAEVICFNAVMLSFVNSFIKELESTMRNKPPGSPQLAILSFQG